MCDHDWEPVPGKRALYRCPCGASGYRAKDGIREHARQPDIRHHAEGQVIGSTAGRKPSLDDYDRRSR
jgi:hypothetical protein